MNERSGLLRNLLRDVNKILVQKSKEKHTRMPTVTKKFGIILTKKKASETPLCFYSKFSVKRRTTAF